MHENNFENTSFIPSTPPAPPVKRKSRAVSLGALCLVSALIGGLVSVSVLQWVSPQLLPAQSAGIESSVSSNSPVTLVTNPIDGTATFPVAEIAQKVGPAVVGVSNFQSTSRGFSFGRNGSEGGSSSMTEVASGSGFIIDAQKGYIVTNNHVIDGAAKITVSLSDGRNLDAKLVGADPRTDLAVLQISDTSNLTAAAIGSSANLQVGESVVAIGNPGGDEFARSVTTGVVSATNRTLEVSGESSLYNLIQTDAAINPGNSGGPLVNYKGEVIGINSAKYAESGFEGMGFAIPITDAMTIINQLKSNGVAKHPALLISINDQYISYAEANNLPQGAYIASVDANGPAGKAGLVAGDVITKINNVTVSKASDLVGELYRHNIGDSVSITYVRDGKTTTVQAVLGEIASNT